MQIIVRLSQNKRLTKMSPDNMYKGENLADVLVFVLPQTICDMDPKDLVINLHWENEKGFGDIHELVLKDELWNEKYPYATLGVAKTFTFAVGKIKIWLEIFDMDMSPVMKSNTLTLEINDHEEIDHIPGMPQPAWLKTIYKRIAQVYEDCSNVLVADYGAELPKSGQRNVLYVVKYDPYELPEDNLHKGMYIWDDETLTYMPVPIDGGSEPGGEVVEGHTHENKDALDKITDELILLWTLAAEKTHEAHTHENKSILDSLTDEVIAEWNSAVLAMHGHENEAVLAQITEELISAWNDAVNAVHTHENKEVLDKISAEKVGQWDTAFAQTHTHENQTVVESITEEHVDKWNECYDAIISVTNEELDSMWPAMPSNETELIEALTAGGEIILLEDIVLTNAVSIQTGVSATLDLNGHTLTEENTEAKWSHAIENKGELTIKNGVITYSSTQPDSSFGYGTNTIDNSGHLVIDGATIVNTTSGGSSNAIDCAPGSTLVINSGTITAKEIAVRVRDGATAVVNDGEITGDRAMQIHLYHNIDADTKVTINGGTFTGSQFCFYSYASNNCTFARTTAEFNGGTFNGYVAFGGGNKSAQENVVVTGGNFTYGIGRYLADNSWEYIDVEEVDEL